MDPKTSPVVLVALLLGLGGLASADETVPGRCLAIIDGKTAMKGDCFIGLEAGGGFIMKGPDGNERYHLVPDRSAGTGSATDDRFNELGPLRRAGACWAGARAKLCAWSDAAEVRKNRDAPYGDFHPLVGKPVRAYCHMGECQWFRYDRAELVDHNAREALFAIREHSWVTEYPDDDYERSRRPEGMSADTFYARCSRTRPSFIDSDGKGGFDFAPGTDAGTYGVAIYVYVKYAAACHGLAREITGIAGVRLGYPDDGARATDEHPIADPRNALN